MTTVAEEKKFNPRLSKDIETFVNIMDNLNLPRPKMIGELSLRIFRFTYLPLYSILVIFNQLSSPIEWKTIMYFQMANYFFVLFFVFLRNHADIAVPANRACGVHDIPSE